MPIPTSQRDETLHILLVEDDEALSRLYSEFLRSAGYRVTEAATTSEAIEILKQKPVLLVVTDWYLPDGNGASVCEQAREQNPQMPVVLISGRADSHALSESNISVSAWLSKPVVAHNLLSTVEQLLGNAQKSQEAAK